MNCPNCGGPATQGFSFNTIYCKQECDLKKPEVKQPFGYAFLHLSRSPEGAQRYWVYKTIDRCRAVLNSSTTMSEYSIWEVSGTPIDTDDLDNPLVPTLCDGVSFIRKVE